MCGIVGVCFAKEREQLLAVPQMSSQLQHRGPDDAGTWFDFDAGVGFGHQRLSIVDLSPSGHQPMLSASGRYVIILNGEIYNHREIRKQLENTHSVQFRGHSDTEVFLAAVEIWGLEKTLGESIGMFAVALWDKSDRSLFLVRDRFGEKPLYYGWINSALVFASELRAFAHFPNFEKKISKKALDLYLRYCFIPEPFSIYENILKLSPGKYLKISGPQHIEEKTYWSAKKSVQYGLANQTTLSYEEATDAVEKKLSEAISLQMTADVPVGAFLSGGVDSSLITALMQQQSNNPIKTFSVGFNEQSFNEAAHAKRVAQHLKTDHTEVYITEKMCSDLLPLFPLLYDEPFADQSQLPTFLLAKLAREKVTVSLSGDAGDELFGGYNRYLYAESLWDKSQKIPAFVKKPMGKMTSAILKKTPIKNKNIIRKLIKYAELFSASKNPQEFYFAFTRSNSSDWTANPLDEATTTMTDQKAWLDSSHFLEWMMWLDTVTYLPDDILTKVDRTTMAVSLENRVPFLDHRVFDFAWQLPLDYKIKDGQGKRILRDLLYRHVPRELVDRPKQGFGFPLSQWMRNSLSPWFEDLLSQPKILSDYWNVDYLKKCWKTVKETNNKQHDTMFWAIFVFQQWLETVKRMR